MICGLFGKTRQAWYEHSWRQSQDYQLTDSVVIKTVQEIRQQMPRIGTRKLYYMLNETLEKHKIKLGRDKLFDLLDEYGLLVRRRKRRKVSTTDSDHPYRKYPNLIRELVVTRPNQLWVSNITYISMEEEFCYLSLVTDAYSRKIVGYCLHPTLKREGPISALKMALRALPGVPSLTLIHHSDRGIQYCCYDYTTLLEVNGLSISMTEKGDPYENAIAERVNGILKSEFLLDQEFKDYETAYAAVGNAISVYNELRPHASVDYLTPEQAHRRQGLIQTKWKRRLIMA
jgi:transposase InsO family protein